MKPPVVALTKTFDAVIACSVLEHVQRPWIAIHEIAKILKPGGKVFIQTHQSFPIHGHPKDYWRFTTEALETLFGDAGSNGKSYYEFPRRIMSERAPSTKDGQAFLNVCIVGEKIQLFYRAEAAKRSCRSCRPRRRAGIKRHLMRPGARP